MKKKKRIRFDMESISDITNELVEVKQDFYVRKTNVKNGSVRFPIPTPIKLELDLKAGDTCFFCHYSEGVYLSFKQVPEYATKKQYRSRKLATAGQHDTLFVCIPPMFKQLYQEHITGVQFIRTAGFQEYEWQLQFLFTDFT